VQADGQLGAVGSTNPLIRGVAPTLRPSRNGKKPRKTPKKPMNISLKTHEQKSYMACKKHWKDTEEVGTLCGL